MEHDEKPRVAICHPRIGWGGSERKVLWGIEALKRDYRISLITAGKFNLAELNKYYGTSIEKSDFKVRQTPLPFFLRKNAIAAALRGSLYQRFCRRISCDYDVLISCYGPCDFGVPAIHFLADFTWDNEIRISLHPRAPGFIYKDHLIRKGYLLLSRGLRKPSGRNLFGGEDKIIAVSSWMAEVVGKKYGLKCRVINSPVPGEYPSISFAEKKNGFVCLGRVAQEKRIERIIEILAKVREKGHDIHLHIIGESDKNAYSRIIDNLCIKHSEWIIQEGRLSGDEKIQVLTKHKYGIHACQGDAFPGAVIEMIKAGCIVWTHNSGGQTDIISHPDLLYENIENAVAKIDTTLKNNDIQAELHEHLAGQATLFSTDRFIMEMREVVEKFISGK